MENLVGQVTFHFLCHIDSAGGLIGKSGSIVRNIELNTQTKIKISKPIPNCLERVITITGEAAFKKRIVLIESDKEEFDVSEAQEGLLKVYERVLEVEGGGGRVVGCRLLAHASQIGAVLGKGGKIVVSIAKKTGAMVKVLPRDQLPPCANHEDVPIQIMGKTLAVKKALIYVSSRLQDRSPTEISAVQMPFHGNTKFVHPFRPLTAPSHGYSKGIQQIQYEEQEDYGNKVVFRLLCPNEIVGGVIGSGGTKIKALQSETGASIKFPDSFRGCDEHVAIISASEELESVSSVAQVALIRVFTQCVDVGIRRGIIPGGPRKKKIIARLLVASNQIDSLLDEVGNIASDISAASNVETQLLAGDLIPNCASKNDNVVQIFGSFENVKTALIQLTSRIRVFQLTQRSQYTMGVDKKANNGEPTDMTKYGDGPAQTKTIEEVEVPEQVFHILFGNNDSSNLKSIREISGTRVEVQEPYPPGKSCYGKVIITGTLERIKVAKTILQAFIQSAPH